MKINHEPIREYLRLSRISHSQMAELGGMDKGTFSRRISSGQPMPSEAIMRWKEHFQWQNGMVERLFFNGPMPICQGLIVTPEELEILKALETLRSVLK